MLDGSKMTLQVGDIGMRSPLARVKVRLSSRTEFRFSIHMASTGPSSTNHTCSPAVLRNTQGIRRLYLAGYYCNYPFNAMGYTR